MVVRCEAGAIPLNQGQYTLRVVIASAGGQPIEVYENFGMLHVLPADVFEVGLFPSQGQGLIYWKSEWSREEVEEQVALGARSDEQGA